MLERYVLWPDECLSVCLSYRLSVTHSYCIDTVESSSCNQRHTVDHGLEVVFRRQKSSRSSDGVTSIDGVEYRRDTYNCRDEVITSDSGFLLGLIDALQIGFDLI